MNSLAHRIRIGPLNSRGTERGLLAECNPAQGSLFPRHGQAARGRGFAALCLLSVTVLAGCSSGPASDTGATSTAAVKGGATLTQVNGSIALQLDAGAAQLAGVKTVSVGMSGVSPTVESSGEVAATDSGTVQVVSRLPGRIASVLVSVGDRVHYGQLLATVDSVDLASAEATYQAAVSHTQLALNQLNQQRSLAKYGSISEPALEDAQRTFAAAKASVKSDMAQLDLDKVTMANTRQLVDIGEVTHPPVETAQNAYAQAQTAHIQANLSLHSAKSNLDRAQILYKSGVYSRQQLEDAETAYNSAGAAVTQTTTQENLAQQELHRQENIYNRNLNGASALQAAQSKLQQDQHTYQNDVTARGLAAGALKRALVVKRSGIPINQALQQATDAYDQARIAQNGSANTLRLYGIEPGTVSSQPINGHVVIPITSPLDGIVSSRTMAAGQMTDNSTPVAKIVNLDKVYVNAQVYENDLGSVQTGSPVSVQFAAIPNQPYTGRVAVVARDVAQDTRTTTVRIIISNPGWKLRPGMFATISIQGAGSAKSITIPDSAVLQQPSGQAVFVQTSPNTFAKRNVSVSDPIHDLVRVMSGLSPGDQVVVAGNIFLDNEFQKLQNEKRG